ncbi:MAG: hypothetical protein H8E05_00575 [Bacteroidetes bacterium]|nr:hypothetical protein [Bacteroidota bacterium]
MKGRRPNKYQKVIRKFLKDPDSIYKNRGLTKREMGVAKKLFEKIKSEKFWVACHLPFKLNSLAWLLSEDGVDYLNLEIKRLKLNLPKPVKYDINDERFGEDKPIKKRKVKTLMEFLKDAPEEKK